MGDGGEEERGGLREEMPCIPLSGQRENHRARGGEGRGGNDRNESETQETEEEERWRRTREGLDHRT